MVNREYEKTKQPLAFSKKQVEKAGRCIRKGEGDREQAIKVIQNFRAAHLYPLTIIKNLVWKHLRKLKLLESATVVRRLKRLPTIIDKLQRATLDGKTENAISLKRMHDIGGCRVILESMDDLHLLNDSLNASKSDHSVKVYDYIEQAKPSGYRGIHRVYKSFDHKESHEYKGFQIEVQLRTRLQHLWATTVEIVDIVERETLKTNPQAASEDWKRLFVIMGEFLAENDGIHELDASQKVEYRNELLELNNKLLAYRKLDLFNAATKTEEIRARAKSTNYMLLVFYLDTNKAIAEGYNDRDSALIKYEMYEMVEGINALLIPGSDLKAIEKAYPNYISDTSEFLTEFSKILLR